MTKQSTHPLNEYSYYKIKFVELLVNMGVCDSKSKAKQLILQGAVSYYEPDKNEPIKLKKYTDYLRNETVIKVGKRFWRKIVIVDVPFFMGEVHEFTSREEEEEWLRSQPALSAADVDRYLKNDWDS